MSKIGNFVMELQEQGALLSEGYEVDREPDFYDYARDYMKTEQYDKEYAEFEKANIESFIASVQGHTL
jgi:hypothetical protein